MARPFVGHRELHLDRPEFGETRPHPFQRRKRSCAIHSIPKSLQEQLPCSPHDAYLSSMKAASSRLSSSGCLPSASASASSGRRTVQPQPPPRAPARVQFRRATAKSLYGVAVMLEFVHPVGSGRRLGGKGRMQGSMKPSARCGSMALKYSPTIVPWSRHNDAERGVPPGAVGGEPCQHWHNQRLRIPKILDCLVQPFRVDP
jgi:hypothetical protein